MHGSHVVSFASGGEATGTEDCLTLCHKCNNSAGQMHQLWKIEEQCGLRNFDWEKDVVYMYYKKLVGK